MRQKIKIETISPFKDIYDLSLHSVGEILDLEDSVRAADIINKSLGRLIEINIEMAEDIAVGKKVIVYTSRMFKIGGVETAIYNIAKTFKDKDITFLFGEADIEQALRVAQFHPVQIDRGQSLDCDVLIVMGYDGMKKLRAKINAKKVYHQIHADWSTLKAHGYKDYKIDTKPIDKFLSVSETAQKGLKKEFGIDSVIVPNLLAKQDYGEFRIFLTLSRLEPEKGGDILLRMLERFKTANKRFLWVICGSGSGQSRITQVLYNNPNVILLPPSVENEWLLPKVDYLVQTSYSEAYCYSIHQAIAAGTPVISTRIPEAEKIIEDGKNGYLVSFDLNDLDVDKIFEKRPTFVAKKSEKVEPIWNKVLNGEL